MAVSASFSSSPGPLVRSWPRAIPRLALRTSSLPSSTERAKLLSDSLGDSDCVSGAPYILQQHGELITAEAGQGVLGPEAPLQTLAHPHQEDIPRFMAQGVVDDLEVVKVHEQQRNLVP